MTGADPITKRQYWLAGIEVLNILRQKPMTGKELLKHFDIQTYAWKLYPTLDRLIHQELITQDNKKLNKLHRTYTVTVEGMKHNPLSPY